MQTTKEKIRQHLSKIGEATAKQITDKIGMKNYPSDVVNALSEMRTDAEVECEKRKGKGNELWYWLTNVSSDAAMPTDKECCNAAKVVATTAGAEVAELRNRITNLEQGCEKQRVLLGSKQEEIEALQDDIRRQVQRAEDAERSRDDMKSLLAMSEQANKGWLVLAAEYECKSIQDLRVFIEAQSASIEKLKAAVGHAKTQNDALNEQLMHGEEAIDVHDAAKGYLVCAPKRKPMKLSKPESALAKATAAAKTTGRCEVFALVPVGVAVRKQVKAVEFKKAKAA